MLAGIGLIGGFAGTAHAASHLPGVFFGDAAATAATATDFAGRLGSSAASYCPCAGTDGRTQTATTGPLAAGPASAVLGASSTTSKIRTQRTATTADIMDMSQVTHLKLLGGLITADTVKAVAHLSATKRNLDLDAGDSGFTNLKINGTAYPGTPAPNTRIAIPNVGTVTLNAQRKIKGLPSSITVNMLSIRITNPSGVGLPISLPLPSGTTLPFGATINIGHAEAGYSRIEPKADVSGEAFGASVADNVGSVLTNSLGRAAYIHLDCMGTNGATESVTADSANAVNAMKVNHATSTVMSGPKGGGMVGRVTSTIESLSILGGLIQGTNVTASAQETLVNGKLTSSVGNSGFGNMTILGVPLPANPPPNTGRALPGLGKVIVNEQILGKNPGEGTIVNGLHISVSTPANALKLPVGTQLYFAHARVVAAPLAP